MSLISDTDYLIHSLRLNYLRNIDDPYGPRLISLDPGFHSNPYIDASGLADVERWPEVAMPTSPTPSDDESAPTVRRRHSGFPGANLKYTTTILGPSRTGMMGLRVNGKRASMPRNSVRLSMRREADSVDQDGPAAPTTETPITTEVISATPISPTKPDAPSSPIKERGRESSAPSPVQTNGGGAATEGQQSDALRPPAFVPIINFKGAAEMERRRRQRLLARAHPPGVAPRVPMVAMNLNPEESSSSSEEEPEPEPVESSDDELADEEDEDFDGDGDSMELNEDEFDPEFAASRGLGMNSDSASENASVLSGISTSASASSMMASPVPPSTSARVSRLSPVREGKERERPSVSPERDEGQIDAMFEMLTPAPSTAANSQTRPPPGLLAIKPASSSARTPDGMFERKAVAPVRPAKSALSAMLAATSSSSSSNPFAELYSAVSGRAESESMVVRVFFPMAREPANRALELNVRKDATFEEVLGFALFTYWEDGWLPKIDEGLSGEEDPKWAIKCSAAGWVMRIAEEDGEVDEDFPPPDRTGKVSKFNFDAYAVLEATPSQIQQNKILESKIQRRISRVVVKKKSTGLLNATTNAGTLVPPTAETLLGISTGFHGGSLGSSVIFPSSLGPSSSHGPSLFLRIRIASAADEPGHVSTTIQASGGMYMAEVLDAVIQKRKLNDPKDYALVVEVGDVKMNIPLDRTVRSLQGKRELILMRKNMLREYGVEVRERKGATTDPNASIFTTDTAAQEQHMSQVLDYMNAYRKYTVYRKMPMLVTRSARMLAIDGGYIHARIPSSLSLMLNPLTVTNKIIPTVTKAKHVFDSGKTSSYHLKSVVACQQSSKNSSTFKLVVHSGADRNKRYEFEAESPKLAGEIVSTIRALKSAMEKPGGGKASRRNTRIGTTARPLGV
ncbi:stress-activated map kinase interacting protein 1-domain-containing protein [Dichomitus squalens]|uniref:Stress-activated map kinase interacting protein 1-domain-containing protein n=1 Tax=Dichomitus squalens TaxID=114155 RepID=A0A4Q9PQ34_9APHY|nr:stress-activated map kinase interacting protein 1-domain-containing protein [Dichomitus squalens]TBU56472.1 stress-activated map kinase interacting protein 1-domain-containing protein [Dichomitus squalens]